MNVQRLNDEINKRLYILDVLQPEFLSVLSRQNSQKLNLYKLTELRSIANEVSNRK